MDWKQPVRADWTDQVTTCFSLACKAHPGNNQEILPDWNIPIELQRESNCTLSALVLILTDITCYISLLHLLAGFLENYLCVPCTSLCHRPTSLHQDVFTLFWVYPVSHLPFPFFPFRKHPGYRTTLPSMRPHLNTNVNSVMGLCTKDFLVRLQYYTWSWEEATAHRSHTLCSVQYETCLYKVQCSCRDPSSSSS